MLFGVAGAGVIGSMFIVATLMLAKDYLISKFRRRHGDTGITLDEISSFLDKHLLSHFFIDFLVLVFVFPFTRAKEKK